MANFDLLKAQIAARIHDNTEQEITAEDVRRSFNDTIDAINAAKEDEGAVAPAAWGGITGTLSAQTDLQTALNGKQAVIADLAAIRSGAAAGATAYQKPSGGIPKTDLNNGVQSSLNKADSAYQKPGTGIPKGDLASGVQTSLGKADTAYQKPSTGIPGTDLANGVRSDLNKARSAVQPADIALVASTGSYNDLTNKPTIPAAPGTLNTNNSTAQNVSSSEALSGTVKLHKVSKTGSYNDLTNKPTIPAAQVQSDWNEADNTKPAYIKNKPAIPPGVTVDQVYDATSANAQSGVAMAGALAGKEDTISDLSTIRSGAAAGATAVQPGALAAVATSGQYSDLTGTPTIPAAPGTLDTTAATAQATSASEALSGSVTLHKVSKTGTYSDLIGTPSLAAVATSGSYNDLTDKPTIPTVHNMAAGGTTGQVLAKKSNTDYDTEWVNQSGGGAAVWGSITGDLDDQTDLKNALDAKQDVISNLATIESGAAAGATAVQPGDLATVATSGQYSDLTGTPSLATVATTGDYDDLLNKPTIPAAQVNSDWNANSGVAQILNKPTIPAAPGTLQTDLATAQSTSASEALSGAVKLHKISKTGDYGDLLNKPTIPTVPTISTDIATDAASDTKTASPKAVADYVGDPVESVSAPTPYDGTVIFTHLSGDTDTVDLNHVHPQYYSKASESSQPVGGFAPDVVYVLGELSGSVTFALASAVSGNVNHYFWTFETGASAPTVTWPAGITWLDGSAPTPGASKHCEVSILGGVGVYMEA